MTAKSPDGSPGANILMIDDNKLGLLARKHLLTELGYNVTVASCAAEGLAIFTAQSFDLVITDYRMPDMDGVELIQRARAHNGAVPIILISGFSTALGLNEESTGADLVLQKCYTEVPQLIHAVTRLLRKSNTPRKRAGSQRKSAAASKRTG